ncbi:MAG: lysophospholipase [Bacillota bacterium]|jgi:lysophospholipase|nr:alpha/beta hydrolase [Bacillota bacterium]
MPEVIYSEEKLKAQDGVELFCRVWKGVSLEGEPALKARSTIVIAHGLADHSGRYEHVAKFFAQKGYVVYAYDHRGQGKSEGVRGHVNKFSQFYDDLWFVIRRAKGRNPGKKCFLVGHSMGGLIALGYAARRPKTINGLIVTSPCLALRMRVSPIKKGFGTFMSWLFPKMAVDTGIAAEGLSHDSNVVEAYKKDPIRYPKITTKFYVEFDKAMKNVQSLAKSIVTPCLFMPGGDDPICSTEATIKFYENVPETTDKKLIVWDGLYHEIMNEPEKDKVLDTMAQWIAEREGK